MYICIFSLQILPLIPLWSSTSLFFPLSLNCSVTPHFCYTTGAVAGTTSRSNVCPIISIYLIRFHIYNIS